MKRKKLSIDSLEIGRLTETQQMNVRGGGDQGNTQTCNTSCCPTTAPPPPRPTELCR